MATDESGVDYQIVPAYPVDENPAIILRLWGMISPSDLERLCWDSSSVPHKFTDFVTWAGDRKALFLIVDGDEIASMFLMSHVISGEQCNIGGWSSYKYRGLETTVMLRMATEWLHSHMKMKRVYIFTPWATARGVGLRAGYKEVSVIPEYFPMTRSKNVHVLMSEV